MKIFIYLLTLLFFITTYCYAELYDVGTNLVYDSSLDITWLKDANYPKTSGAARAHSSGYMTWQDAVNWVNDLEYGGATEWRLPSAYESDLSGPYSGFGPYGELGKMFYNYLGNNQYDFHTKFTKINSLGSLISFDNIQMGGYWTSTVAGYGANYRWTFNFFTGASDYVLKDGAPKYVWPVHDGNIGTEIPDTTSLYAITFMGETLTFNGEILTFNP